MRPWGEILCWAGASMYSILLANISRASALTMPSLPLYCSSMVNIAQLDTGPRHPFFMDESPFWSTSVEHDRRPGIKSFFNISFFACNVIFPCWNLFVHFHLLIISNYYTHIGPGNLIWSRVKLGNDGLVGGSQHVLVRPR